MFVAESVAGKRSGRPTRTTLIALPSIVESNWERSSIPPSAQSASIGGIQANQIATGFSGTKLFAGGQHIRDPPQFLGSRFTLLDRGKVPRYSGMGRAAVR